MCVANGVYDILYAGGDVLLGFGVIIQCSFATWVQLMVFVPEYVYGAHSHIRVMTGAHEHGTQGLDVPFNWDGAVVYGAHSHIYTATPRVRDRVRGSHKPCLIMRYRNQSWVDGRLALSTASIALTLGEPTTKLNGPRVPLIQSTINDSGHRF
jgi:hypothetical protein